MKKRLLYLALAVGLVACNPTFFSPAGVEHHNYPVSGGLEDTARNDFLSVYRDSMNMIMNRELGTIAQPFVKPMPASSLGYFITDAFLWGARNSFNQPVDLAFVNNGGIRLNEWPKGSVSLSRVYETLPFDNIMVLVKARGDLLQQFMDHISQRGGWPISGGTYTVQNGKATDIRIGNMPLDTDKTYTIALSDYVVNGGDDALMFSGLPIMNNGYLQRDALIDYIVNLSKETKTIPEPALNRVKVSQ